MIDFSLPHRVLQAINDSFTVDSLYGPITCHSRKKVKRSSEILAGDMVYLEQSGNDVVIKSVEPRRNSLIRPAVANIDQVLMLLAPVPAPDYLLTDKLILNCHANGIKCILCANKTDLRDLTQEIRRQYDGEVSDIVTVNVKNGEVSELLPLLKNKITCLAGQSAVGKSSLTNLLIGKSRFEVGELSAKLRRGKNTTTVTSLVALKNGAYIVDTPGFSLLDVFDIDGRDLSLYYDVYVKNSEKCKYRRCTHILEPGCEVRRLVEAGILPKERYERYKIIATELKNRANYKGGTL